MYTVASLISQKGNNFGSSGRYINYMGKDTGGILFDSNGNEINAEAATLLIDNHSKGGIRKNESRWYSPVYSLSEDEALHIANSVLEYGTVQSRNISDFYQLNAQEKLKYNEKVKELALEFQNQMAKNFNKEDLGIKTKDDILWFGVVENKRHYTGYDSDVKQKNAKQGQKKRGFNTHIHIVQSRKALNEKRSLISPMANARAKTKQGAGFDRNIFYNLIEQTFDRKSGYKRNHLNTFEYYKSQTKTKEYWKDKGYFTQNHTTIENRKPKYAKNYQTNVDRQVIKNSRCIDYFFMLEKRGLISFEKKIGVNYYFRKNGQKTGSIAVSEKGWKDFSSEESGGIIKAIQLWDKFDWSQSISLIKSLSQENSYIDREEKIQRKIELIQDVNNKKLIEYIESRGITHNLVKKYLKQVHYKDSVNSYYSLGFKNNSQGYVLRNYNFKSNIGSQDITTINFDNTNKGRVLLFEGFFNYLSYIQIYGKTDQRAIIMNSSGNLKKVQEFLIKNNIKNLDYYGDNDNAGNKILKKLDEIKLNINDKRYLYKSYVDLNDYLSKRDAISQEKINIEIKEKTEIKRRFKQ